MKERLKECLKSLFSKGTAITLLAFIVAIGMRHFLESLAINYVVEPFLSKFTRNSFIDVFLILALLVGTYSFIKDMKNHYKPSTKLISASLIIALIYSGYRFYDTSVWCFEPTYFCPKLKYTDLLLLLFVYQILIYLAYKVKSLRANEDNKNGFLIDAPTNNDKLNRTHFAKHIAQKLLPTKGESAFAMGIIGQWGSGKTSFLKFIKQELLNKAIVVEFNPWLSENPKSIRRDFFDALKSELSNYDGSIASDIGDYSQKLTEIDDNIFSKTIKALKPSKSIFDEYEDVKKSIEQLSKPLIILIDDVDRLDKKEIVEVLRLIRNTANFGNTSYIVAYDRGYVIEAISEINPHNKEQYLEKIFQLEVTLPVYESIRLREQLEKQLTERIAEKHHEELKRIVELPLVSDFIDNMRDVSRFVNSFMLVFEKLEDNIEIQDLFVLELIKLKYLSLYQDIYKNKLIVEYSNVTTDNRNDPNQQMTNNNLDTVRRYENEPNKQQILVNAFKNLCSDFSDEQSPYQPFLGNNKKHEKSKLSIIHASKHDRYFAFRLMQGDISEIEFGDLRTSLNREELAEKFKEWDKSSWSDLREKIETNSGFDSIDDHQKMAYAAFKALNNGSENGSVFSSIGRSEFIIRNFFDLNKRNLNIIYSDKSKLIDFITELCITNATNGSEIRLLQYLKTGRKDWVVIMKDDELKKIQATLFKKLIDNKEKIKDMSLLTYACWSGEHELMIGYVEQNMIDFFVAIIDENGQNRFIINSNNGIECIWNSKNPKNHNFEGFNEYIMSEKPPKGAILDEFKEFWVLLYENRIYDYGVQFKFKQIPVRRVFPTNQNS